MLPNTLPPGTSSINPNASGQPNSGPQAAFPNQAPGAGESATARANASAKHAYAKRVTPGKPNDMTTPPGVQKATAPIEHTDNAQAVNEGLPVESPQFARAVQERSAMASNIDHNSFANDNWRADRRRVGSLRGFGGLGGFRGPGSMMGMGSMYGMGGMGSMYRPPPPAMMGMGSMYQMGSMYGMQPMMGSAPGSLYGMGSMNMSRSGSLFGSLNGSMYGSSMGSLYNNGSMRQPGGSFYGGSVTGSMYGLGPNQSFRSSQNGMGNMSAYGSMYGGTGPQRQYSMQGNMADTNMFYQEQPPAAAPTPAPAAAQPVQAFQPAAQPVQAAQPVASPQGNKMQPATADVKAPVPAAPVSTATRDIASPGRAAEPAASPGKEPAEGGANGPNAQNSKNRKDNITGVVVLAATAEGGNQPATVSTVSEKPNVLQIATTPEAQEVTVDEVVGPTKAEEEAMNALKEQPSFKSILSNISAGHNVALLLSYGPGPEQEELTRSTVNMMVSDVLATLESNAAENKQFGYYDAQLFCCAFQSDESARDLVANDVSAPLTDVQLGSHPVFGVSFMNMKHLLVRNKSEGMTSIAPVLNKAMDPALKSDTPIVALQMVVKQVRDNQKESKADVLLSSILFVISHTNAGTEAYFAPLQDSAKVPQQLMKGAIGGACRTVALLCLSPSTEADRAVAAARSVQQIRAVKNSSPRSGNVARFINFASSEVEKLRSSGKSPAVLSKVEHTVKEVQKLLKDPKNVMPTQNPVRSSRSDKKSEGSKEGQITTTTSPAPNKDITPVSNTLTAKESVDDKKGENVNAIRTALIASPEVVNGKPATFTVSAENCSFNVLSNKASHAVDEVVLRAPDDWRSATPSLVNDLQSMFHSGNNTAVIGTASMSDPNSLDKQPLWLSYKRMVSSLLTVATKDFVSAEVSLSVALVSGNMLLADLLAESDTGAPVEHTARKLSVAFSPLFGPVVHKTTSIKPPTSLQLESAVNTALHQVPGLLEQYPEENPIIFASAVLKGVTENDVFTSTLTAASASSPDVFLDILQKKPDVPCELFEYALGGPCCTLYLADIIQGDTDVDRVAELIDQLRASPNRTVRNCSVKKFIAFAEESLKRVDGKLAKAKSEKEKEHIMKEKKSMEVFYEGYKALFDDPQHQDPKTYRKSGGRDKGSQDGRSRDDRSSSSATRRTNNEAPVNTMERKRSMSSMKKDSAAESSGHSKSSASRHPTRSKPQNDRTNPQTRSRQSEKNSVSGGRPSSRSGSMRGGPSSRSGSRPKSSSTAQKSQKEPQSKEHMYGGGLMANTANPLFAPVPQQAYSPQALSSHLPTAAAPGLQQPRSVQRSPSIQPHQSPAAASATQQPPFVPQQPQQRQPSYQAPQQSPYAAQQHRSSYMPVQPISYQQPQPQQQQHRPSYQMPQQSPYPMQPLPPQQMPYASPQQPLYAPQQPPPPPQQQQQLYAAAFPSDASYAQHPTQLSQIGGNNSNIDFNHIFNGGAGGVMTDAAFPMDNNEPLPFPPLHLLAPYPPLYQQQLLFYYRQLRLQYPDLYAQYVEYYETYYAPLYNPPPPKPPTPPPRDSPVEKPRSKRKKRHSPPSEVKPPPEAPKPPPEPVQRPPSPVEEPPPVTPPPSTKTREEDHKQSANQGGLQKRTSSLSNLNRQSSIRRQNSMRRMEVNQLKNEGGLKRLPSMRK